MRSMLGSLIHETTAAGAVSKRGVKQQLVIKTEFYQP